MQNTTPTYNELPRTAARVSRYICLDELSAAYEAACITYLTETGCKLPSTDDLIIILSAAYAAGKIQGTRNARNK